MKVSKIKGKKLTATLLIAVFILSTLAIAIPTASAVDPVVTITSSDIEGPYVKDVRREFSIRSTSDTAYSSVLFTFVVDSAELIDIAYFWSLDGSGNPEWEIPLTEVSGNLEGYFGPLTGFPIDDSYDVTTTFRIEFATAKTYPVTLSLVNLVPDPDEPIETVEFSLEVVSDTIVLNSAYYKTGDIATVTVYDWTANLRPLVTDIIEVEVASSYPDVITLDLTETGVATGVFKETFTLVGAAPGPKDLLVDDEDTVTVTYTVGVFDEATIDDAPPITTIIEPADEALISDNSPTIRASVADDGVSEVASAIMTLDDVIVASKIGPGELSYSVPTYPEEMRLNEGLHTVVVNAIDNAGNSATETWTFTVDLVKPTVIVVVESDPTMEGDVTFTLTFNEDMGATEPVVKFGIVSPYTTYTVSVGEWTSLSVREWIGIYPVIPATVNGLNTISISTATDKAGNVMETDISNTFVIDTIAPTKPTALVATVTDVSVTIDWTASTDVGGTGVKEYVIECDSTEVDTVAHPITTYVDYSLTTKGPYTYTVTAVDFAGNTDISAGVLAEFVPGDIIARVTYLSEGWNLFSLPLIPDDSSIEVVLADVMENVDTVWGYKDDAWSSYLPAIPEFSTLTDMVDGEGYWVKMTAADKLSVSGVELPGPGILPPVYDVYEGWNLIGFKEVDSMEVTENLAYFTTIPKLVRDSSVCYSWDATLQEYEMAYIAGTQLIAFDPGQGYWLYLTEDANIVP